MRVVVAFVVAALALAPHAWAAHPPHLAGYFPQWGLYNGFFVRNVVASGEAPVLTQIDYAFANVARNRCASFDPYADYQAVIGARNSVDGIADNPQADTLMGNFHQLSKLKKLFPKIKLVMSIGGGGFAAPFQAAALPANREAFVASCIDMYIGGHIAPGVEAPGLFDGFDIDWEYPLASDTANFTALLAEFRRQLDAVRPGLSLTIAASADSGNYQNLNLGVIPAYLDFVGVMTYDYNGPWNNFTGFGAPLYQPPLDPNAANNVDASVRGFLASGVPPAKIVIGLPFYGYSWFRVPSGENGLYQGGAPANQGLPYWYIQTIEASFPKFHDPVSDASWLYDGRVFWTYDDPAAIALKMVYARDHGLGGAMVWELSNDTREALLLKTAAGAR